MTVIFWHTFINFQGTISILLTYKDFYQVQETLKKLCQFSTVWADQADLGSQRLFSKLTKMSPRNTYANFQIIIQKITQIRKSWALSFSNQKEMLVLHCKVQMFAGNCRDSAGGFLQYLQGKPCNIYRFTEFAGKSVYNTGFSLQILQKIPCRVPAIPCKHLHFAV